MNAPDERRGLTPPHVEPAELTDQQLAALLASYDEALRAGAVPDTLSPEDLPEGALPRLERAQACLQILEQLKPRHRATEETGFVDSSTGEGPVDPLPLGSLVNHYRVLEKLGGGGMGVVYKAQDTRLGREVALKFLPPEYARDRSRLERFQREARTASALNHPNICTIHDIGEWRADTAASPMPFIVMEYVEGETLKARLERGPLDATELFALGLQVADAVAAAHAKGIIHRDLKPGNIMIGCRQSAIGHRQDKGESSQGPTAESREPVAESREPTAVKVVDFGLATMQQPLANGPDAVSAITGTGLIVGTIPYMSPEQTRGETADARSDVFSLGCVLHEAATGKRPFSGPSALAIMHEIATADPPPPSALKTGLPRGFDRLVGRAMAKDMEQRYPSAKELADALRECQQELAGQRRRKIVSRLALAAAAVAVLAGAIVAWSYWQQFKRNQAVENLARVEELAEAEKYFEAYDLAVQVKKYLPDDPTLAKLMPVMTDEMSVSSEPAGARVYLKRFARDDSGQFPARQLIGTTPIRDLQIARGEYVLYIEKDGYAPLRRTISSALIRREKITDPGDFQRAVELTETPSGKYRYRLEASAPIQIDVRLVETAKVPERMVYVPGGKYEMVGWDKPTNLVVQLDDYFIDQFEVTNREYKEFVSAGGYRKKELWKHPFVKDGKELAWEEAMPLLRDRTGLPGPRGWSNQDFPEGKADHPVSDVTWYEAAAYAAFRGKQLPTVFQWEKAARDGLHTFLWECVMPWGVGGPHDNPDDRANFRSRGTLPVQSLEFGMSPYGCYHMAGNVTEWCINPRPLGFTTTGASWNDPLYHFGVFGQLPGFYNADTLGFRCVKSVSPAARDQGGMALNDEDQIPKFQPVDEAQFQTILSHYKYDPAPLHPQILEVVETEEWRREKISFAGAGGERAFAYLYLPKHFPRPLQVIHYSPSNGGSYSGALTIPQEVEAICTPLIKSGRALFAVVLKGFRERKQPPGFVHPEMTEVKYRDMAIHETIDQQRGLDYLVTRSDLDMSKLACLSVSVVNKKYIHLAVEKRYRSVLLLAAGLHTSWELPCISEACAINFVPYVRPSKGTLVLNGRFDEGLHYKTAAEPLFRLLPEPKKLVFVEYGHFPPMEVWVPIAKDWFDQTLGPVSAVR